MMAALADRVFLWWNTTIDDQVNYLGNNPWMKGGIDLKKKQNTFFDLRTTFMRTEKLLSTARMRRIW